MNKDNNNFQKKVLRHNVKQKIIKICTIILSLIIASIIENKEHYYRTFIIVYYSITIIYTSLKLVYEEVDSKYLNVIYLICVTTVLIILFSIFFVSIYSILYLISYTYNLNTYFLWFVIITLSILVPNEITEKK